MACPTADVICRGEYPWEHSGGSSGGAPPALSSATPEQLVTQLRLYTNEGERAEEELRLLQEERTRIIAFLQQRQAAIQEAIGRTQARQAALQAGVEAPECSSFAARQAESGMQRRDEQQYCAGLLLLLADRLQSSTSQLEAACTAFACTDWDQAAALGAPADEFEEEEEDM